MDGLGVPARGGETVLPTVRQRLQERWISGQDRGGGAQEECAGQDEGGLR